VRFLGYSLAMASSKSVTTRRRSRRDARQPLGPEDWLDAARAELIAAGISAVKVGRLARRLRVTRGSFYWHFTSHGHLLRELLTSWERVNTDPFERVLSRNGAPHGVKEFLAICNLWLEEKDYSPAFDTAVRDWARTSSEADAAVRRADERRINILRRVFLDMGYIDPQALVRARVAYFHQVGYYTLKIREDRETRLELLPTYMEVLLGISAEALRAATAEASC
jgi:AcrR family transcriptional regulator